MGLFVFNKPAGIPTLPRTPEEPIDPNQTAVGLALQAYPNQVSPNLPECGLLHRLDNETSGLLLFATTEKTYQLLKKNWKSPLIQKTYECVAVPTDEAQTLKLKQKLTTPIAHHPKSKKRMVAVSDPKKISHRGNPQEAWTQIEKLKLNISPDWPKGSKHLEVAIRTGVRHQIRIHLKSVGWPILGDKIYGKMEWPRMMLHSRRLTIAPELAQKIDSTRHVDTPPWVLEVPPLL